MSICRKCYKDFTRPKGTRRHYCSDACRMAHYRNQPYKKPVNRYAPKEIVVRMMVCACGTSFKPNGRQKRCDDCRLKPTSRTLREADIPTIRARYKQGETAGKIARDYHMSRSAVWSIANYQTWRHLP